MTHGKVRILLGRCICSLGLFYLRKDLLFLIIYHGVIYFKVKSQGVEFIYICKKFRSVVVLIYHNAGVVASHVAGFICN